MKNTKILAIKHLDIGDISPDMFSSFIEHLGRAVYEGIYEPTHKTADENGFRQDVIDLIKELKVKKVRYPGGNYLSGYRWEDGIGPKENRKRRFDMAWSTVDTNEFGTDEFMKWCDKSGCEPLMAVNLGTGSPQDGANLAEYCNFKEGTYYSDLRKRNGRKEPYKVESWCLGNEMDGVWQICHLNAEDYSKKALETAKMIRWIDPKTKLVVCGSASVNQPTFPEWDKTVCENLYDFADFLSVHQYYWWEGNDDDFYASYVQMDEYIKTIKGVLTFVKAKLRSKKDMYISFDEWNVWYQNADNTPDRLIAPHILEDVYTMQDALVFGGLMNTLLNNCDVVKMACLAQLVNVIAPIMTQADGPAIRQTIFYPFKYVSNNAKGKTLRTVNTCDKFDSKYGKADYVSSAITYDDKEICIFLVNYAAEENEININLNLFKDIKVKETVSLFSDDLKKQNTFKDPFAVVPTELKGVKTEKDSVIAKLPPFSWNMIKLSHDGE